MQNFSLASLKNSLDEVRAQVYPRNETERKVYEALSSKNWGASSTLLSEIASDSNDYEKYGIMSTIIWANLDTDGKSWKQIFKTLTLIDFLIKNGSERFIEASRDKLYKIRTLQDFNFYEGTVDKGSGVREKAKSLVEMLGNNEIIRSERDKARQLRNKFVGIDSRNAGGGGGGGSYGGNSYDNNGGGSSNYGGSGGNGNNGNNYGGNSNNNSYGGNSNGGRYGGESSYDNNGRYGDQGIDSQSSNNRRGSDTTNHGNTPSRYGGGAYDSDHPPRYGDDAPAAEEEDNKPFRSSKPKTPTSAPTVSGGGKLKVSIKKAAPADAAPRQTVAAAPEIDLFGDGGEVDFMSAGAATAAPHGGNDLFDAFSSAPAAPQQQQASFDPFGSAPSVAPSNNYNAQVFDPFGAAPPVYAAPPVAPAAFDPFAAAPQTFPPNNNNFQPAYQQQQQQQPLNVFQNNGFQQAQQQQQQPVFAPQTQQAAPAQVIALNRAPSNTFQQQPHEADFGDFEAAPQQQQQQKSAPAPSKWGDLGKLVDLSGIGKNEVQAKPNAAGASGGANNNYQQSAFAGLDGFSKTVHNMGAAPSRPLNYPPQQQMGGVPMGGMARPVQQPMGMVPPVPMGCGMGMGAPLGYGAPQMQPQGPYGGGFQQQQQPNNMYAPQMQQQYGQQQQPGMMMGGGYVQQQQPGMGMGFPPPQQQYAPNNGNRNPNGGFGF